MKKIFTLLLIALSAFGFKAQAQPGTTCNPLFSISFVNGNTVKFTPAINDSPAVHHYWRFGDGSPVSNEVSPTHAYLSNGTFTVMHNVIRINPNGIPVCGDSSFQTIIIQQAPSPCNLIADYSWLAAAVNPLTIEFHNLSTPLALTDSITWIFGDNTSSHDVNPVHTYANAGTYTVCLIVKKWPNTSATPCIKYICKTITVQAPTPCTLVVNFSSTASATNPLSVQFTNLSTPLAPADSSIWSFGDGTSSYAVNPLHIYTAPGTYNVCLIVKKMSNAAGTPPCVRYLCKTITVTPACNIVVNFSSTPTIANPLVVEFHNLSVPLEPTDSITWIFGDSSANSHDVNPVHTYAHGGTYNVCLIIKKNWNIPGGTPCVRYLCKPITVTQPCTLVVDFSSSATGTNPLVVSFHNLSTPLEPTDSITWIFGDSTTSHDVNPVHTYAHAGTYNVCLIVKKNNAPPGTAPCVRYLCKNIIVQAPCNLVAYFTWHADSLNAQKIWFTNLSTPVNTTDSVRWTFGDGTSSNVYSPDHVYAQPGTYTVCLRMQQRNPAGTPNICVSEICKVVVVAPTCNLVVGFNWHADAANALKIWFTNNSTPSAPTDSLRWTFGDGTSSNLVNPDHTYLQAGTYTVCLRVQKRNNAGTVYNCVREWCQTIIVQPTACNFTANYSWRLDSLNSNHAIFTNLTIVPTATATALWSFGDGTTATSWNADHMYTTPGRYKVCLRVQLTATCVRYFCDSITIPVPAPPCNNQSNFRILTTATNSQTFSFVPDYQSAAAVYTWTFGDGTGSHDMIATHHYNAPGTYTACLTVWRSASCASTTCKTVTVTAQINCDSIHVGFTYQFDPFLPNKVYFYANANFPILDQTWTITKLPAATPIILHQNNPNYVFNDTGYYRVCLRAITLGGCVKEYCQVIHIEHVSNVCQLQAYPNPASSIVNVNVPLIVPETINAYVFNALNVLVAQKTQAGVVGNNVVSINISALVSGVYTIKIVHGAQYCTSLFQKL